MPSKKTSLQEPKDAQAGEPKSDTSTRSARRNTISGSLPHRSAAFKSRRLSRIKQFGLGSRGPSRQAPTRSDPYDYEEKYGPDNAYEEMSESGRVWKTSLDEFEKYDMERADDWRDGLDMLLVFAALFSAVVSAFVTEACQSLRVDTLGLIASSVTELIDVQRAIGNGSSVNDVPSSAVSASSFYPAVSDLWVNGLWFTSLGLSLTTALMAILGKQWVHQYMTLPSGSPRTRARIRHFRYEALEKWHVPIIIGLLPVLMHLSLGIFFIGLVIYLHALCPSLSVDFGLITATTFIIYFTTNGLPLIYPDCPYKTPVSLQSYAVYIAVRRRLFPRDSKTSPKPYDKLEHDTVAGQGVEIDARLLSWLYNATSNFSVKSIVLQALGNIPLRSIALIKRGIPFVHRDADRHFRDDQSVERFERLQRAILRFHDPEIPQRLGCREPSVLHLLEDPSLAVDMVKSSILGEWSQGETNFDIVIWGAIFTTALSRDMSWLEISDKRPSKFWMSLLRYVTNTNIHSCKISKCEAPSDRPILTFPSVNGFSPLCVEDYPIGSSTVAGGEAYLIGSSTGTATSLGMALSVYMRPSFLQWVLRTGFPSAKKCVEDYTMHLPDDIFLTLVMLNTPSVQRTSSLHATWKIEENWTAEFMQRSLFRCLLVLIEQYAMPGRMTRAHKDVDRATIRALQTLVSSDIFISGGVINRQDEITIVRILFSGLPEQPDGQTGSKNWIHPQTAHKILGIALAEPSNVYAFNTTSHVFSYFLFSPALHLDSIELIYTALLDRTWLEGLGRNMDPPDSGSDTTAVKDDPFHLWHFRCTSILASLYVDGLEALAMNLPILFSTTSRNLENNLFTMSRILLVADMDSQARLWKLAKLLPEANWSACLDRLVEFSGSVDAQIMYSGNEGFPPVRLGGTQTRHVSVEDLPKVAMDFANDIRCGIHSPPRYLQDSECTQ